jgi:hypothetical protein
VVDPGLAVDRARWDMPDPPAEPGSTGGPSGDAAAAGYGDAGFMPCLIQPGLLRPGTAGLRGRSGFCGRSGQSWGTRVSAEAGSSAIFSYWRVRAGAGGSGVRRDRRERDVTAEGAGQPRSPADRPQSLTAASIVSRLAGRLFPHLACGPDAGSKPRPGIPEHGNGFRHRRCRLGFVHTPSLADERDTCEPDAAASAQASHIRAYKGTAEIAEEMEGQSRAKSREQTS